MVTVTLLGNAALMPLPERALTAAVINYEGHTVLIDCGEGTQSAARKAQVSLMKTDLILLTHYHGDHTLGIPGLLQTMGVLGRENPLYIMGPHDIRQAMAPFVELCGGSLPYPVYFLSIPEEETRIRDLIDSFPDEAYINTFRTKHRCASTGYVFSVKRPGKFDVEKAKSLDLQPRDYGKLQHGMTVGNVTPDMVMGPPRKGLKIAFTGDSLFCREISDGAKDADLLICEATYGDNEHQSKAEENGHMTFRDAATCAKDADAKLLWLTHFSQMISEPEEFLMNATEIFENSECGFDGKTIELKFED